MRTCAGLSDKKGKRWHLLFNKKIIIFLSYEPGSFFDSAEPVEQPAHISCAAAESGQADRTRHSPPGPT
jgi:hypothetical protein